MAAIRAYSGGMTALTVVWSLLLSMFYVGCSGRLSDEPMFYDKDRRPIYVDDIYSDSQNVSLARAVVDGEVEAVSQALENGSNLDFEGAFGITPLWLAVKYDHPEIVQLLLDGNASTNAKIEWVSSIIGVAAEGNPVILKSLIDAGESISVRSGGFERLFPIHHAARSDHTENISMLVGAGADIDVRSESGITPLLLAGANRKLDNVMYLLRAGADPAIANSYNATVVDLFESISLNEEEREKADQILELIEAKRR